MPRRRKPSRGVRAAEQPCNPDAPEPQVSHIFRSKMKRAMTPAMRVAEALTEMFGTVAFFLINGAFFLVWILINMGMVPGTAPFDPFPFNFLTMTVSLEAIFLSIIVLISQNQASKIAEVREQIDLQVNVQAEQEVTKILRILDRIQHRLGMGHRADAELKDMKEALDLEWLEDQVVEELRREKIEQKQKKAPPKRP